MTFRVLMDTKLVRLITYLDRILSIKLNKRSFTWSCGPSDELKFLYLPFHIGYDH